ncbi:hypothetical protein B0H63DRAFT_565129 [Podospora didyma]|uniref:Uncharacterized protein n=1 Tax=Podospora didyma TaxID=330526 RepID=A0AAE0K1P8_9PEZI|nr:hypothetical protein B0H63DRAFT_565129 [Podospora didyma]
MALETALCALCVTQPGTALPGIPTPALGPPYPSLPGAEPKGKRKLLVIYGGSSSAGSMTTQLAVAAGMSVLTVAGAHNAVQAVQGRAGEEFVAIVDAVSSPETYAHDLAILERLGGGHLACVHPPPVEEGGGEYEGGYNFCGE